MPLLGALRFFVPGDPSPKGSTVSGVRPGGGTWTKHDAPKLKRWEGTVRWYAISARNRYGWTPTDRGVVVGFEFIFPRAHSGKHIDEVFHIKAPDLSKLIRATEDALQPSPKMKKEGRRVLIEDDAQIVCFRPEPVKRYQRSRSEQAGCWIEIRLATPEDDPRCASEPLPRLSRRGSRPTT